MASRPSTPTPPEPMWMDLLASCSRESIYMRFQCFFQWQTHEAATRYCFNDYDRESAIPRSRPGPEIIRSRKPPVEPLRSNRGPVDLETISPLQSFRTFNPSFDEIFDNLRNALDIRTQRKGERFQTLTMEIVLTPNQASRGGMMQILLPIEAACSTCGGSGDIGFWQCWRCNGTGVIREEFPLEVEYPPGIRDLYQVAIPLDRFGLHELCPILLFRISPEGDLDPGT